MQNFRTIFDIAENKIIDHKTQLMSLGSCFSENIGSKLKEYHFHNVINPFGILYNPESIAQSIELLIKNKSFTKNELLKHNGIYYSFYHHSRFSNSDAEKCLSSINNEINNAHLHLKKCNILLITFGTSWVYKLNQSNQIISNCHKLPAKYFTRFKLNMHDIVKRFTELFENMHNINPNLKIVFTVSPVRHLKDGAAENQLSKATLILAIHQLVNQFSHCSYFPSYEIMIDDLRDYRFYNEDMMHPSAVAVNYIWNRFVDSLVKPQSITIMKEVDTINQALKHRPFQPESEAHQKFISNTLLKIEKIEKKYLLDFKEEKQKLNDQMIGF